MRSSSSAPAPGEGSVEAAAGKQKGRRKKKKQKNAEGEELEVAKTVEDSPMPSTEELPSMAAGAGTATEVIRRDVLGGFSCRALDVLGGKAGALVYVYSIVGKVLRSWRFFFNAPELPQDFVVLSRRVFFTVSARVFTSCPPLQLKLVFQFRMCSHGRLQESPSSPSKTTADKTQDKEAASPASSSASFHTPMKGEAKSAVDDAAASSARKTVTFGKSMAKGMCVFTSIFLIP